MHPHQSNDITQKAWLLRFIIRPPVPLTRVTALGNRESRLELPPTLNGFFVTMSGFSPEHRSRRRFPSLGIICALIGNTWLAHGTRAMGGERSATLKLRIPESLVHDHREILEQLENGARAPGTTGEVARELRELLMPHFRKEEQTALPMLGALVGAAMWKIDPATTEEVLTLHRSLRDEYARMLGEHEQISKVLFRLLETAESEENARVVTFVRRLLHHRKMEEEVLYPAAIVLGDRLQAARGARTHAPHPSRPYKH